MLAETLARPDSPAIHNLLGHTTPRILTSLGSWLTREVRAGRIRDLPLPLLLQLLIAPVAAHMLLRPALSQIPGLNLPEIDATCHMLTDAFLRATATHPPV